MKQKFNACVDKIYVWLASIQFFIVSILFFIFHTTWLALSSNLLPYDEYFHVGIIKYYSTQWLPFISDQPASASYYGDLTRLPSYLYHYIMSFPYRLFNVFIDNETIIIVLLRFINIAMVVCGILLFRKLFIRAGISKRIINITCAVFMLTPLVVTLAAQSNYDNLIFLITPIFFGFAYSLIKAKNLQLTDLLAFITLGCIASLVKNTFLVIFGVGVIYVTVVLYKKYKSHLKYQIKQSYKQTKKIKLILFVAMTLLFLGLFIERHGYNIVTYKDVSVSCIKVQPESVCSKYSPWNRNETIRQVPPDDERYGNVASFTVHWVATMTAGLYPIYANIPHEVGSRPDPYGDYEFKKRLPALIAVAYIVLGVSTLALLLSIKRISRNELLKIFAITTATLGVVLFVFNYRTYLKLGRAYAIQSRYLYPVLLAVFLMLAVVLRDTFKDFAYKKIATITILGLYFFFGGTTGWIIRAEENWYWQNQTVKSINMSTQSFLKKVVPN